MDMADDLENNHIVSNFEKTKEFVSTSFSIKFNKYGYEEVH